MIKKKSNNTLKGSSLWRKTLFRKVFVCLPSNMTFPALSLAIAISLLTGTSMLPLNSQKATASTASDKRFSRWVQRLWPSAKRKGISRSTFNRAFRGITPDPEVLNSARYQPEFVRPVWDYMASAASDRRIAVGQAMLQEHKTLLGQLEHRYKVGRHVIVAIWGMESNYGHTKGDKNVIRSLATLAYLDRRRHRFGRQQLLSALRILQRGDISTKALNGSWAGAMGHTQFIPTTYAAYGVDFDGDGKRDIWNNQADALASTANYLHHSKWRFSQTWGYEVKLPKKMTKARSRLKTRKKLSYWKKRGLKRVNGKKFPRLSDRAALYLPAGRHGPAFLVLNNFRSILRYNNAATYALAVGHLADRLAGSGKFVTRWPTKHKPLAKHERLELQKLLTSKGFDTGGTDGIIGNDTVRAVRKYQKSKGLKVTGWPSTRILKSLRNDS